MAQRAVRIVAEGVGTAPIACADEQLAALIRCSCGAQPLLEVLAAGLVLLLQILAAGLVLLLQVLAAGLVLRLRWTSFVCAASCNSELWALYLVC